MDEYTRPHPSRAALLTIDVQRDFTLPDAPATIEGTVDVVPQVRRLVEAFRSQGTPIVHVVRLYRADGSNVDVCRRRSIEAEAEVVRPGSDGAELVDELVPPPSDDRDEGQREANRSGTGLDADRLLAGEFQPLGPAEWAMYKPRWGAFYETPLSAHLDERGVDTLVVCGCNFPNCPRTTVYEASERDFRVVFVADATSGTYERGLEELESIGVAVLDVEEVVAWLDGDA